MKITKTSNLPPGLKVLLCDTFRCTICRGVVKPPATVSKCCQSIVGCEDCIDDYYRGDEGRLRGCPLCRRERASGETSRLNGLGDFLDQIKVFGDGDDAVPSPPPLPESIALSGAESDDFDFP